MADVVIRVQREYNTFDAWVATSASLYIDGECRRYKEFDAILSRKLSIARANRCADKWKCELELEGQLKVVPRSIHITI